MARLFTAVELSPDVRAVVAAHQAEFAAVLQADSRDRLRLLKPGQLHLTLVFLGDVADEQVPGIENAVSQGFQVSPFELEFGGCGVFPPRGPVRVLWLGVTRGARELTTIADMLGARFEALGIPRERRPFTPHLTLGRWRDGGNPALRHDLPPTGTVASQRVSSIALVRSRLLPGGAEHTVIAHGPLAAGAAPLH
jgi:RNA 2',3'-cyclic 3'-phosphodiesterase